MHCINCGKPLVDGARFCAFCGTQVQESEGNAQNNLDIEWESCQVEADWIRHGTAPFESYECFFWANAVNKKGTYKAGMSSRYSIAGYNWVFQPQANPPTGNSDTDKKMASAVYNKFVKKLIDVGWEPTGEKGNNRWQIKLRRKLGKTG